MATSRTDTVNMLATLMVAVIAALLPGCVTSSCDKMGQHAMNLRSCFKIHQMDNMVMIHSKETTVETSLQVEGLLENPQQVCRDKEKFRGLFDCLDQTTVNCAKEGEKDYVPDAASTKEGLEYFCQHVDGIDQGCYNQSYREVFSCVNELSAENLRSNDTASTRACVTVDITHDCIHEHVSCDEKTRDLLLKYQDEYRKPKGCLAPTRSDRKKYITSTGSSLAAFVSKLFCVCLSFCLILLHTD